MKKTYLRIRLKDEFQHLNRYTQENMNISEISYDDGTITYIGGIKSGTDVLPIDRHWAYTYFMFDVLTEDEALLALI